MTGLDGLPMRADLAGRSAVRRAAARRRGPAQHQREPAPALADAGRRASPARSRRGPRAPQPLPRPRRRGAARRPGRLPRPRADRRRRSGRPTAPTRSCSSCCRRSAGPGRTRAGLRAVLLDAPASSPRHRHRLDRRRPRADDFGLDPGTPWRSDRGAPARRRLPLLAEQPDRHRADARRRSRRSCAAAPGMVVVDEAYAEFARAGTPSALEPAAAPPAAGGHPHDEQGVRLRRRPGRLPGRRPGGGRRAAAGALPYHLSALTQAAARAALAHADELLGTVEAVKAQRDRIVDGCAAWARRWPTRDANFVLFGRFARPAARSGRRCSTAACWSATSACPGWLRVTAGTAAEDRRVPGVRWMPCWQGDRRGCTPLSRRRRRSGARPRRPRSLVELDLDGTGQAEIVHRRRLLRPHARPARPSTAAST